MRKPGKQGNHHSSSPQNVPQIPSLGQTDRGCPFVSERAGGHPQPSPAARRKWIKMSMATHLWSKFGLRMCRPRHATDSACVLLFSSRGLPTSGTKANRRPNHVPLFLPSPQNPTATPPPDPTLAIFAALLSSCCSLEATLPFQRLLVQPPARRQRGTSSSPPVASAPPSSYHAQDLFVQLPGRLRGTNKCLVHPFERA
jgi:hypothetical protein